jgi:hypothetical protein
MATLVSSDLRSRLVVVPRKYQFRAADNPYDLNWLVVDARLQGPGVPGRVMATRLATWELDGMVRQLLLLADGQRSLWHPRFFDSGLHLWIRRATERNDACQVTALLSPVTGPLPVEALAAWNGQQLTRSVHRIEGVRFRCSRDALGLFALELGRALQGFPVRTLQKTG